MSRSTIPIALVLVTVAGLLALALPELLGLITNVEAQTTGVSGPLIGLAGLIPIVLFVLLGIVFTAILVIAVRR